MKTTINIDCLVIGAGVVGLAVARALAQQGREVYLLERESSFGMGTSSRNSEVIHAGIYYPKDSLKAKLCVRGKAMLYDYCDEKLLAYKRCGKLIVASSPEQLSDLENIRARAVANGVEDLSFLDSKQVSALEPDLNVLGALLSPSTGIIDSHQYMTQLLADFESFGGQLVYHSALQAVSVSSEHFVFDLQFEQKDGGKAQEKEAETEIVASTCVNSAGLHALSLFKNVPGFPQDRLPTPYFAKGEYFSYSSKVSFQHLIYPVPEPGGLGIHLSLDLAGNAKFGPDVSWLAGGLAGEQGGGVLDPDSIDYKVDVTKQARFAEAVRQYWPDINAENLHADYSGVRPKLSGPNALAADFMIQHQGDHHLRGLVNLFGIESPGLTSSLAIAERVAELL